jgi:hypothetical protein
MEIDNEILNKESMLYCILLSTNFLTLRDVYRLLLSSKLISQAATASDMHLVSVALRSAQLQLKNHTFVLKKLEEVNCGINSVPKCSFFGLITFNRYSNTIAEFMKDLQRQELSKIPCQKFIDATNQLSKQYDDVILSVLKKTPSLAGFVLIMFASILRQESRGRFEFQKELSSVYSTLLLDAANSRSTRTSFFGVVKLGSICDALEIGVSEWGQHNPTGFRLRDTRSKQKFKLVDMAKQWERALPFLPRLADSFESNIENNVSDTTDDTDTNNRNVASFWDTMKSVVAENHNGMTCLSPPSLTSVNL